MTSCRFGGASALAIFASLASTAAAQTTQKESEADTIVVTARQRSEKLTDVPVAVTALTNVELTRANANDLSRIGELASGVIIANYQGVGGGSLSIRGISSPAVSVGFEQEVSVSIDGVQSSNGLLAKLGFFDMQQVEILKGPQALLFGKNSPAGVISITTAGPTRDLNAEVRASYEFVADEAILDGIVSGPLTDQLGFRIAVRGRTMKGWMYNDAVAYADNPFIPGPDNGLRGTSDRRVGSDEVMARFTLAYTPTDKTTLNFKVTYARDRNAGSGAGTQNIGPCPSGHPKIFGVADTAADCKIDNHTASGDPYVGFAPNAKYVPADGKPYGKFDVWAPVLTGNFDLDKVKLTSVTGYTSLRYVSYFGQDQTSYSQVALPEAQTYRSFSQEVRGLTNFKGWLNFMVGGYYQDQYQYLYNALKLNDANLNPVNGSRLSYIKSGRIKGKTLSFFTQGIIKPAKNLELSGGVRWTQEKKDVINTNDYGFPVTTYPTGKQLIGNLKDDNWSPEATIRWTIPSGQTVYAAYRTGYKSGGFNLTNPITVASTIAGSAFGPESAKGFDVGVKGELLDRRFFFDVNAFRYTFSDLQVISYNPALVSFTTTNAGEVRQYGVDFKGTLKVTREFQLSTDVEYLHNRFHNFVGQCYGYSYAVGDVTSPPPPNCRFRPGTRILEQNFENRAPARSPTWSGRFGGAYTMDIGSDLTMGINGDAFYTSGYYSGETMASATYQSAFWRFNASIDLTRADGNWGIGLNGRNLTNKYYLLFGTDRTGGASVPRSEGEQRGVVARGREITIHAFYRFR